MEPFWLLERVNIMAVIKFWPSRPSEHEQFKALLQPYLQQLYKLAFRFTGQRADAEDLVQDVVVKLYPRLQEMQKIEQLSFWLARVLYRQFIDRMRSKQRSPLHLVGDDEIALDEHKDETTGPAENVESTLLQKRLQAALNQLNEDQRALIIMHDVEGYTLSEIHTMFNIPVGTLKSRLNRARSRLRELLKSMEPFTAIRRVT
ncbi:RNA polymerase ECF-type sigma factor [hydrothermal vent metagenome]|uniref:RNA polymerase ECF-type sigma factor n=1 Tax=hydrothermal vent metagenome TaxID=652676 RepID=A0A3B0WMZ2_9ZZZZ